MRVSISKPDGVHVIEIREASFDRKTGELVLTCLDGETISVYENSTQAIAIPCKFMQLLETGYADFCNGQG